MSSIFRQPFSPELFYRVLSKENGFQMQRMVFAEVNGADWYEVCDPETIKSRIQLRNSRSSYLMVCARKVEARNIFERFPQQSDYAALWECVGQPVKASKSASAGTDLRSRLRHLLPPALVRAYEFYTQRFTRPLFSPREAFKLSETLSNEFKLPPDSRL